MSGLLSNPIIEYQLSEIKKELQKGIPETEIIKHLGIENSNWQEFKQVCEQLSFFSVSNIEFIVSGNVQQQYVPRVRQQCS